MENHHDSTMPIVLKVNIDCCDACPNKLREVLLKIEGVENVKVYKQMNMVVITDHVDQEMLINVINEHGKKATPGCLQDLKKCYDNNIDLDNHHVEDNPEIDAGKEKCSPNIGTDRYPQNGNAQQNNRNKCYCKGNPNYKNKRSHKSHHKVDNLEQPKFEFDEEICKDRFCRIHMRDNGVPPGFGRPSGDWNYPPRDLGGSGYVPHQSSELLPPTFRGRPPPYGYPSLSMPPPGYGGSMYSSRPQFGNNYSGDYYDYEANKGCATM